MLHSSLRGQGPNDAALGDSDGGKDLLRRICYSEEDWECDEDEENYDYSKTLFLQYKGSLAALLSLLLENSAIKQESFVSQSLFVWYTASVCHRQHVCTASELANKGIASCLQALSTFCCYAKDQSWFVLWHSGAFIDLPYNILRYVTAFLQHAGVHSA